MIFFKGSTHSDKTILTVPGYSSSEPEEPIQFMNPGLYMFDFDVSQLENVNDYLNGRDHVEKYRNILPGVIGIEGTLEIVINIPTQMSLVNLETFGYIVESDISHHTRIFMIDILLKNKDLYGFSEADILALDV